MNNPHEPGELRRLFSSSGPQFALPRSCVKIEGMTAWHEVAIWLKQNWLALFSFVISVFAAVLSYKKFAHDTRPMLILRSASEGNEIENVGQAVAVNIRLALVERAKRSSGVLSVPHTLRPGERSTIGAFDWPEALTVGLNQGTLEPMSEWVLRMDGRTVHPTGARVARYLMARERIVVILRYRAGDRSKTYVRLFRPARKNPRQFPELVPVFSLLRSRLFAVVIEKLYGKNAELARPFEFPSPAVLAGEEKQGEGT
jgi:hypothetical protein